MQLALRRMESQGNLLVDSDYDEAFYTDLLSIETNGDRGEVPSETRSGNPATPKTSKHRLLESSALKTRIAVQDEKSRSWYVKDTFGETKKENSVTKAERESLLDSARARYKLGKIMLSELRDEELRIKALPSDLGEKSRNKSSKGLRKAEEARNTTLAKITEEIQSAKKTRTKAIGGIQENYYRSEDLKRKIEQLGFLAKNDAVARTRKQNRRSSGPPELVEYIKPDTYSKVSERIDAAIEKKRAADKELLEKRSQSILLKELAMRIDPLFVDDGSTIPDLTPEDENTLWGLLDKVKQSESFCNNFQEQHRKRLGIYREGLVSRLRHSGISALERIRIIQKLRLDPKLAKMYAEKFAEVEDQDIAVKIYASSLTEDQLVADLATVNSGKILKPWKLSDEESRSVSAVLRQELIADYLGVTIEQLSDPSLPYFIVEKEIRSRIKQAEDKKKAEDQVEAVLNRI